MMIELTWESIGGVIGALSFLGAIAFWAGNRQWYQRTEGEALEKTLLAVSQAVRGMTDLRTSIDAMEARRVDGERRLHKRLDDIAETVNQLVGASR